MVPRVCTLKKKASANEPGLAFATPPVIMNTTANATLIERSWGALTTSIPVSSCGTIAMRPSIARPGGMARKQLLRVRRVLYVLLHRVLLVARVLLRVADAPLRMALGLRDPAVRAQLVLRGVLGVGGRVLDVLHGVALGQRRKREAEGQRGDDSLQHSVSPSQAGPSRPAVLREAAHGLSAAQRSG